MRGPTHLVPDFFFDANVARMTISVYHLVRTILDCDYSHQ